MLISIKKNNIKYKYMKLLLFVVVLFLLILVLSCKKETFENMDKIINETNNGQWGLIGHNPNREKTFFKNSFVLVYDYSKYEHDGLEGYLSDKDKQDNVKKYMENLQFDNNTNVIIKELLNSYINSFDRIRLTQKSRKNTIEYTYRVQLKTDM